MNKNGFTLIELIVVIALIGIVMFSALPRFQRAVMDPSREVSRWLLWHIPEMKQRAAAENRQLTLQVDLSENKLWTTQEGMTEKEMDLAAEKAFVLPEEIKLLDVEFPYQRTVSSGTVQLHFYPKGYSDRAILHLKNDDNITFSFIVEPFLDHVQLAETYVGYSGK